jgi:CRP/FNR family cyclic AMP-dependent transcriptional regulator
MSKVPPRFRGKDGRARLLQALCSQKIVAGDEAIAKRLLAAATVTTIRPGKHAPDLMSEGEFGSDIFFILSGSVAIRIKRKQVNVRSPGDHVGEMALIDPLYPRSATVTALESTEVARVAESEFTAIAQDYPIMWRRLCVELGNRLRQRGGSIPSPNKVPVVFIASSSKKKHVMNAIERAIQGRNVKVEKWTKGVFGLSATNIESLEKVIGRSDFAIVILSGDDVTEQRGKTKKSPRDNCVFELGLGMGALGRQRTFILKESGELHLPTDVEGVTYHSYDPVPKERMQRQIQAAARKIKVRINELKTK